MTPQTLAAIRQRWTRITDQDIGEAQNTIQALLEAVELMLKLVENAARWADYKPDNTILAYEKDLEFKSRLHEVIAAFRAQVGQ